MLTRSDIERPGVIVGAIMVSSGEPWGWPLLAVGYLPVVGFAMRDRRLARQERGSVPADSDQT